MTNTPPPSKPASSARKTAVSGALWTLGGYGFSQVVRLASNLILAHLLYPGAFGLMALVNTFMQGLEMMSDVGVGPSIIQSKRGSDRDFLNTAWTIQVIRGFVLWLVSLALAYPVARFFAATDPAAAQLSELIPVAGLSALFGGFTSTAVFTLNRRMAMGRVTALALVPQLVTLAAAVAWAQFDASVWAIVAGGLCGSFARLAMSHAMNDGPANRFAWDAAARQELSEFGRWVMGSTLVSFLAMNLDRILLGRLLSLAELGVYSIGMTFARVATHVATRLSNTVVFPMLARYKDQPERLIEFCLRARRTVLWASAAICSAFALLAPPFFSLLYDNRYAGAGRISQWLSLYVWCWVLTATMDRIPLALGKPKVLFASNVVNTAGMLIAITGYRLAQLPGFITGMAFSNLVAHAFLLRVTPLGRRELALQSIGFTLPVFAYTLGAILLLARVPATLPPLGLAGLHAAAAALPCAFCGAMAWRLSTRDRRASA